MNLDSNQSINERLTRLEGNLERLRDKLDYYASKEHVLGIYDPLKQSIHRMEHAVSLLTTRLDSLFDSYDELLKQRVAETRQTLEDNTLSSVIKRWATLATLIIALITVFRVAGTFLEVQIDNRYNRILHNPVSTVKQPGP